jgi:hypothetical protein
MLRHLHASQSDGASSTRASSAPTTVSIRDSKPSCSAVSTDQLWVHRLARMPSAISATRGGSSPPMQRSRIARRTARTLCCSMTAHSPAVALKSQSRQPASSAERLAGSRLSFCDVAAPACGEAGSAAAESSSRSSPMMEGASTLPSIGARMLDNQVVCDQRRGGWYVCGCCAGELHPLRRQAVHGRSRWTGNRQTHSRFTQQLCLIARLHSRTLPLQTFECSPQPAGANLDPCNGCTWHALTVAKYEAGDTLTQHDRNKNAQHTKGIAGCR